MKTYILLILLSWTQVALSNQNVAFGNWYCKGDGDSSLIVEIEDVRNSKNLYIKFNQDYPTRFGLLPKGEYLFRFAYSFGTALQFALNDYDMKRFFGLPNNNAIPAWFMVGIIAYQESFESLVWLNYFDQDGTHHTPVDSTPTFCEKPLL